MPLGGSPNDDEDDDDDDDLRLALVATMLIRGMARWLPLGRSTLPRPPQCGGAAHTPTQSVRGRPRLPSHRSSAPSPHVDRPPQANEASGNRSHVGVSPRRLDAHTRTGGDLQKCTMSIIKNETRRACGPMPASQPASQPTSQSQSSECWNLQSGTCDATTNALCRHVRVAPSSWSWYGNRCAGKRRQSHAASSVVLPSVFCPRRDSLPVCC